MNEGKFLAEALMTTLQSAMRSMALIVELESRIEEFRPRISETTAPILRTFLENSKSAVQTSFDTTTLLTKEVTLSEKIKEAINIDQNDSDALSKYLSVMVDYHEYGLLIATSFLASAALHDLLAALADKPNPTMMDSAKEIAGAGCRYLVGLAKRAILVDEVEEALALVQELEESLNRLENTQITLTLQHLAALDREIETFSKTAQTIASLGVVQKELFQEAEKFAVRLSDDTNG